MKGITFYIGAIIAAIGLVLLGVSNLVLFGTFIYEMIKTDLSFFQILFDSIKNTFAFIVGGIILLFGGLFIRDL